MYNEKDPFEINDFTDKDTYESFIYLNRDYDDPEEAERVFEILEMDMMRIKAISKSEEIRLIRSN